MQRLAERDRAIAQLRAAAPARDASALAAEQMQLSRDQPRTVKLAGPATIQELRPRVASDKLARLASVRVSVRWDAVAQNAIDLRLLDLFAARRAVVARSTLALAATTSCRYDCRCRSRRLRNGRSAKRRMPAWNSSRNGMGAAQVPDAAYGYLHVQQNEAPRPAMQREQSVAQVMGRGRYVGMCADLEGRPDGSLASLEVAVSDPSAVDLHRTVTYLYPP